MGINESVSINHAFLKEEFNSASLLPSAVLNAFQTAAIQHMKPLNIDYATTYKQGFLWVITRTKYIVHRQPEIFEKVIIKTWAEKRNVLELLRHFEITSLTGEILITGLAGWCLIDVKTRKLAKLNSIDLPCDESETKSTKSTKIEFSKVELIETNMLPDITYQVMPEDIDFNNHMNNTVYAKLTEKPLILPQNKQIKTYQVNFIKEAYLNERIDVYKIFKNNKVLVLGKKNEAEISFSAEVEFMQ